MKIAETLADRHKTHGNYKHQAATAQKLKAVMREFPNWESLPMDMKESLELIATKLSRIGHGDPYHMDSWHDIEGYARLICKD